LQKDFGPEHVEVKKTKSSVDDLHEKINARVDGILLGLDAKVKSTRANLEDLERKSPPPPPTTLKKINKAGLISTPNANSKNTFASVRSSP